MAALVTNGQLASRLQMDLDASTATDAVNSASGIVRRIGRQQYSLVSQETVTLRGNERILTLPERPAIVDGSNPLTVIEVGEFGGIDLILIEDRDYSRVGNELTRGYPWYWNNYTRLMGYPRTRPLGVFAPRVRVTYSHGYATIPDDVQSITLDVAAVLYDNPTGLRGFTIDDYTETKAQELLGAALYDSVRMKLKVTGRRKGAFSIRTA
jgi:hypothetical protein